MKGQCQSVTLPVDSQNCLSVSLPAATKTPERRILPAPAAMLFKLSRDSHVTHYRELQPRRQLQTLSMKVKTRVSGESNVSDVQERRAC